MMVRMTKLPKRCLFCGQAGQITKEHAWPKWLGADIHVFPTQSTQTTGFGRSAEDVIKEKPNLVVSKQGSVLTTRIREVCARCNSGWMSRLESDARPLLKRLWAPSYPFGRTSISHAGATTLAAWATKTAWVRERVDGPSRTTTPVMRRALMDSLRPPDLTTVWFARHKGQMNFGAYVAELEVTRAEDRWDTVDRRRVLICAMAFRGLAVTVRTDSGPGVSQMELPQRAWRRLWPTGSSVQWPPSLAVGDADVRASAAQFTGWLSLPDSRFERDPGGWRVQRRN